MKTLQKRPFALLALTLVLLPALPAAAFDPEASLRRVADASGAVDEPDFTITQGNGKTLSEAIEQVRRRTDGRIVSAETRVSGGREVHHIKVLTKDGKVKTHKVQGRKLDRR
ncbi:MAG: hypothetical protein R3176_09035 [Woeseiaceae bacterium]|nr:hypothetical protein [Woeseiaceae bacterium]